MQIILASANAKKIKELKAILGYENIVSYKEILGDFEISEDGVSFSENAWIKARAIENRVQESEGDYLIIADGTAVKACETTAETVPAVGKASVGREKSGSVFIPVYQPSCDRMAHFRKRIRGPYFYVFPHIGYQLASYGICRIIGIDQFFELVRDQKGKGRRTVKPFSLVFSELEFSFK